MSVLAQPGLASRTRKWADALGLGRPELRAWALYDWANSAMVTTVITAVFPIYFASVAAQGLQPAVATYRFALATTLALAVVAVVSPPLGALADRTGAKKRLLALFTGLGAAAVAAMFFIGPGDWLFGAVLFAIANVALNACFVFYDALLPHVARPGEVDRVSTAGYALGYVGGGVLLAFNLWWIASPATFGLPEGTLPARLAFVSVAIWWAVFSLPLFKQVKEPPPVRAPRRSAAQALKELGRYPQALLLLAAFLLYNDGIGTIIRLATVYGEELKLDRTWMIAAILIVQFVGVPCSFAFGPLAKKVGARRAVLLGLAVYGGITVLGYAMTTTLHFILLAVLVGTVQGGTQALSRSLFASLIPRARSAELFGLFSVADKVAGLFGPLAFSQVLAATGSSRLAVLSVLPFFAVGALLLARVDVEAGQRAAQAPAPLDATGHASGAAPLAP